MIYPIVKFPDPILQRPSAPVTEFNDELRKLVADMFESMYAAQGIGLAAPQIGIAKRLTVIDLSNQKEPKDKIVLINPEITLREGKQLEEEGCLSLPEIREKVRRSARVIVKAQDEFGEWKEHEGTELLARAFQHTRQEQPDLALLVFVDQAEELISLAPSEDAARFGTCCGRSRPACGRS